MKQSQSSTALMNSKERNLMSNSPPPLEPSFQDIDTKVKNTEILLQKYLNNITKNTDIIIQKLPK